MSAYPGSSKKLKDLKEILENVANLSHGPADTLSPGMRCSHVRINTGFSLCGNGYGRGVSGCVRWAGPSFWRLPRGPGSTDWYMGTSLMRRPRGRESRGRHERAHDAGQLTEINTNRADSNSRQIAQPSAFSHSATQNRKLCWFSHSGQFTRIGSGAAISAGGWPD